MSINKNKLLDIIAVSTIAISTLIILGVAQGAIVRDNGHVLIMPIHEHTAGSAARTALLYVSVRVVLGFVLLVLDRHKVFSPKQVDLSLPKVSVSAKVLLWHLMLTTVVTCIYWLTGEDPIASSHGVIDTGIPIIYHLQPLLSYAIVFNIGSGMYEELLFRGIITNRLRNSYGMTSSVVIASLLFILCGHINANNYFSGMNNMLIEILRYTIFLSMSAFFAYIYWKHKSIWLAGACHMLTNTYMSVYNDLWSHGFISPVFPLVSLITITPIIITLLHKERPYIRLFMADKAPV